MNYEEKYKEALERAKEMYKQGMSTERLEYVFPELEKSKDEKIIDAIKHGLKYLGWEHVDGIRISDMVAWIEKQCEPQDKGEISDGYHTFNELYYYRMLYNAAFFNMLPKEWVHKSKRHNDGEECFGGGWFIVMANLPTGQISNHYELKDWDLFQIPEKEVADKWDGHTPQEAADRLHKYLLEKQSEQSHWKPTEEQLQTIHTQLNEGAVTYPDDKRVLTTLYEDLMKITTQEEKQGEQKETPCGRCRKEQPSHSCQDITELGRCALEHQSKQESNRVKPKIYIKKGQWYVCIQSFTLDGNIVVAKGRTYQSQEDNTISGEDARLFIDKHDGDASKYFRPWTIQDAKDGDVLICGNQTFLFKCIEEKQVYCYGYIWRNKYKEMIGFQFCNQPNQTYCYIDSVMSPATKEQRDTLFTKMKEAGYEWDADKKELKKVEPKFNVGDFIVYEYCMGRVVELTDDAYLLDTGQGILFSCNSTRLWDIAKDAKDGDVLLFEGNYNSIVLFQGIGINGKERINYHCKCDLGNYSIGIQGDVACLGTIEKDAEHYHPATKEQRELLFAKMKEAGYEWNAEKKELKKIEPKPD